VGVWKRALELTSNGIRLRKACGATGSMGYMGPKGHESRIAIDKLYRLSHAHTPTRPYADTPLRRHPHLPLVSLILIPRMYLVTKQFGTCAMEFNRRFTAIKDKGRP
jgi:hypothetical protein